jgi:Staphylococcal nuclease homologue
MLDGMDVNLEQVKSGSAWVYEKHIDQVKRAPNQYHAAQTAAQQERRGLWSDTQTLCRPGNSDTLLIDRVRNSRASAGDPTERDQPHLTTTTTKRKEENMH